MSALLSERGAWWKRLQYDLHSVSIGQYCEREGWESGREAEGKDGDRWGVVEIQGESAVWRGRKSAEKWVHILAGKAGQSLINKLYSCFSNVQLHHAAFQSCAISGTDFLSFYTFLNFLFPTAFFPWRRAHVCKVSALINRELIIRGERPWIQNSHRRVYESNSSPHKCVSLH